MIGIEVALIMTVGGIAGSILVSQMWQLNWFKRENFKYKQSIDRKENSLRFRKLEKDLKLKESGPIPPREKGLLESLQGLDPAIIQRFLTPLQKDNEEYDEGPEYEEKPDITTTILEMAKDNPDLVKKFIGNLGSGSDENKETYL